MAKTKPYTKRSTKNTVSTKGMFSKLNLEARRLEEIGQRKFAIEKAARIAKTKSEKHEVERLAEHSLATAFSGEMSKMYLLL